MLNTFNGELQHGGDEILGTVNNIKDQAFDIGKEVGRYEGIVEENQWLIDLQFLVKGGESLNPTQVRTILLLVMRGAQLWTKLNTAKTGLPSNLPSIVELLVKEMELWQV